MTDKKRRMITLVLIMSMAVGTKAYQSGAPASQCTSLMPNHGATPQATASPYTLDTTLTDTNSVQVSILSSNVYRGFILVGNEGSGMFTSLPSGAQSVCEQSRGATHTSNSDKSNMTFTWTPPATFCGNIVFRATVVQTRPVFWTGIMSQTLRVNCTGNRTEMTTTTLSPTTTGSSGVTLRQTTPRSSATQNTNMALCHLLTFSILLYSFYRRDHIFL